MRELKEVGAEEERGVMGRYSYKSRRVELILCDEGWHKRLSLWT